MEKKQRETCTNCQIKTKDRVKHYAEVFTAEREVKAMCDMLPEVMYSDITKTFLEPACGEGTFLIEIFKRKLTYCKNDKDGLIALNSLFGIDIQSDNVMFTQRNLVDLYMEHFPEANGYAETVAWFIVKNNIVCDDMLNPQTEIVKSWGITPDNEYIKKIKRIMQRRM